MRIEEASFDHCSTGSARVGMAVGEGYSPLKLALLLALASLAALALILGQGSAHTITRSSLLQQQQPPFLQDRRYLAPPGGYVYRRELPPSSWPENFDGEGHREQETRTRKERWRMTMELLTERDHDDHLEMTLKPGRNFVMIDREEPAMDAEFWQAVATTTPVEDYDSFTDDVRRRTRERMAGEMSGIGRRMRGGKEDAGVGRRNEQEEEDMSLSTSGVPTPSVCSLLPLLATHCCPSQVTSPLSHPRTSRSPTTPLPFPGSTEKGGGEATAVAFFLLQTETFQFIWGRAAYTRVFLGD
eukprot:760563-Hanusia_phi.AAC.1